MKCPHCKSKLVPFTLDLLQCKGCWAVHEKKRHKATKRISLPDADETLKDLACPIKGCD